MQKNNTSFDFEEQIIVHNPKNSISLLLLYDMVVENSYRNNDYQEEYKNQYLYQKAKKTYAHIYGRFQVINKLIVNLLELET
ncbi:5003_t:CDS:2 [Gigaspora margarita]|uniref:5003_t:CDS:1 n=1 Tax=Gigaspora margarita TaxID=4874 RepID=A0ABN7UGG1_GIGMA|nr:5003_t:CDS:2 [Gigaspora margarita]